MKLTRLELSNVCLIENDIFQDERGSLSEVYKDHMIYEKLGFTNFLELEVESVKGVLRGLHYQLDPHAQAKIVRVVNGSILDVVVDIRRSSKTFGKWCSNVLDSEKKQQLYVPRGFAHGYYTLEPNTKLIYKLDNLYTREVSKTTPKVFLTISNLFKLVNSSFQKKILISANVPSTMKLI